MYSEYRLNENEGKKIFYFEKLGFDFSKKDDYISL